MEGRHVRSHRLPSRAHGFPAWRMALKGIPRIDLEKLVRRHLSIEESPETAGTLKLLAQAKTRGCLTRDELISVCRWKSPRAIRHVRRNRAAAVERTTRKAFASEDEAQKLTLLLALHGVSVPMASSILMLTDPSRYGVIDIRVWQFLHATGTVGTNPNGQGFSIGQWLEFLDVIRSFGKTFRVTPRAIERTLFGLHQLYQHGTLYKPFHRATKARPLTRRRQIHGSA